MKKNFHKAYPIKCISIEECRHDYPGHPEKPSFIANVDGIDTYILVGLKVEDGSIITYNSIRDTIWQVLKANNLLYSDRESIIRLAYIHYRLLGCIEDDIYNHIINVLSGAIPAANTIDKVKRLIDQDRADDYINGSKKVLDFFGEQISAIHFALILNGNKYTTNYAHYLSYRLLTSLSPEKICDRIGCPSDVEAFKRMETF